MTCTRANKSDYMRVMCCRVTTHRLCAYKGNVKFRHDRDDAHVFVYKLNALFFISVFSQSRTIPHIPVCRYRIGVYHCRMHYCDVYKRHGMVSSRDSHNNSQNGNGWMDVENCFIVKSFLWQSFYFILCFLYHRRNLFI